MVVDGEHRSTDRQTDRQKREICWEREEREREKDDDIKKKKKMKKCQKISDKNEGSPLLVFQHVRQREDFLPLFYIYNWMHGCMYVSKFLLFFELRT